MFKFVGVQTLALAGVLGLVASVPVWAQNSVPDPLLLPGSAQKAELPRTGATQHVSPYVLAARQRALESSSDVHPAVVPPTIRRTRLASGLVQQH